VAPHYLEESEHEIGIPNVVTSVLASYRGYDTMGETTVIFTAMVGVLLLMRGVRRREGSATLDGKPDREGGAHGG
jgi:multicomponent Na+:H+ antiporter subunit B